MIDTQPINHFEEGEKITLSRVCQHLIRNCDKTRLRKKAGLPEEEEEEGGEGEEGAAKEWTQARNLDEEVEGGGEREGDADKVEEGEVEREVEKVGDKEDGEGQKREEAP